MRFDSVKYVQTRRLTIHHQYIKILNILFVRFRAKRVRLCLVSWHLKSIPKRCSSALLFRRAPLRPRPASSPWITAREYNRGALRSAVLFSFFGRAWQTGRRGRRPLRLRCFFRFIWGVLKQRCDVGTTPHPSGYAAHLENPNACRRHPCKAAVLTTDLTHTRNRLTSTIYLPVNRAIWVNSYAPLTHK